jgi:hypothetical protein
MSDQVSQADLLAEIESRQDDVLRKLDELNSRVEQALAGFGSGKAKPLTIHEGTGVADAQEESVGRRRRAA